MSFIPPQYHPRKRNTRQYCQGQEITKYGGEKIGEKVADERSKSNLKIVTVAPNNKRFNRTYQGEGFHIKRIGGTDKYIDSKTSLE